MTIKLHIRFQNHLKRNPFLGHRKGLNKTAADFNDRPARNFSGVTSVYTNKDPERYDRSSCWIIPETSGPGIAEMQLILRKWVKDRYSADCKRILQ